MTSLEKNTETKLTRDVKEAGGKTNGTVDLPAEIFDAPANIALLHQVVIAQLAAARQGTHATKTRGEVRGGGKKPYRQKGTGRARQGSTRAPQFVGGGTVALAEHVIDWFPNQLIVAQAAFANARGMLKYGRYVAGDDAHD